MFAGCGLREGSGGITGVENQLYLNKMKGSKSCEKRLYTKKEKKVKKKKKQATT